MNIEAKGRRIRSNPYAWADGGTVHIDTAFLEEAKSRMKFPVIRELLFHLEAQVTGVTATLLGIDAPKFYDRILVKDRGGVLVDLPGSILRIVEQMEIGSVQADNATLASAATNGAYNVFARCIFDVEKAHRGADTAVPVHHLAPKSGGQISVRFGTPPGCTVTGATLYVYAICHDERSPELKSRMVWQERSITALEDTYQVGNGGSLRAAFVTSDIDTTGYTSLAAQTSITSQTFQDYDLDTDILRQEYRRSSRDRATADSFLAATPEALPIIFPFAGQHIGKMPNLDKFHLKLTSAPTAGRMVTCHIEDRNASLAAETMGYESVPDFIAAFKARGEVRNKGGSYSHVSGWDPSLVRRLPARIGSEMRGK